MLLVLVSIRMMLCAVFGVAGVAKLLDQRGTREAVLSFGVPSSLAGPISSLLPLSELAIALSLLFGITTWWGALGAFVLLSIFIAVIAINLQRGRNPECHCFGQLYSRPLGPSTLLRNIAFALLAVVLLWQGFERHEPNLVTFLLEFNSNHSAVTVIGSLLVMVAVALTWFYWNKRRAKDDPAHQHATPNPLPLDSIAPAFELAGYDGSRGSLDLLLELRKPVMLLFSNPNCGPCAALFREVGEWQRDLSEQITIAVISQGTIKDNFVNTVRNNLKRVFLQQNREVAEAYAANVTPTAIVVRGNGRIGSSVAAGADEIRALLLETIGAAGAAQASRP